MSHREPPASGVESFRGPRGSLHLWKPAPRLVMIRHEGFGEARVVAPFGEALRRELLRQPCHVFHDTTGLVEYQTGYRVAMISLFSTERERMLSVHALVKSSVIALGAAVANIALGGVVKVYSNEQKFDDAVARALGEEGARPSR